MQTHSKRIAKNTLMLYIRQILTLLIGLYTVRVVLEVLGVEDYGIYSVVGGIVLLFSFLSASMASATQRFFSFALGEQNENKLKKIFTVNLVIYLFIAVIAFALLETFGLWFVRNRLNVPPERFIVAQVIYQYSVFALIVSIFTSPFMAIIIAHEDMQIYAYVSIVEAILRLGIVFLLVYLPFDKLELYGILVFVVAVINAIIYIVVCSRKYQECQFKKFFWDKVILYEIVGFTSWTLFGQFTTVVRNHGVSVLLNQFFDPIVVAARAIATTISNKIMIFSNNFNISLYPPIIKLYAVNDKKGMYSLVFNGSKLTFFLMWIFALPMFLETETILNLWLKNTPPNTVLFTRLALVEVLIVSMTLPIATAARAKGRMKAYELTLGSIQLGILPGAWIVLSLGAPAYSVYVVTIGVRFVMFIVRLFITRLLIGLELRQYLLHVIFPLAGVVLLSVLPLLGVNLLISHNKFNQIIMLIVSIVFALASIYFVGLDKRWRKRVKNVMANQICKVIS